MKKYLLFHGDRYYPGGGWSDFVGDFDTIEQAKAALDPNSTDSPSGGWAHIVDTETRREVAAADCDNEGPPKYASHTAKWDDE